MPSRQHRGDSSIERTSASSGQMLNRPLQLPWLPQYVSQEMCHQIESTSEIAQSIMV
jgi:hypothetical protein